MILAAYLSLTQYLKNPTQDKFDHYLLYAFHIATYAIGVGSMLFHGMLTHFSQMLDELPMLFQMVILLILLAKHRTQSERKIFGVSNKFSLCPIYSSPNLHTCIPTYCKVFLDINFVLLSPLYSGLNLG